MKSKRVTRHGAASLVHMAATAGTASGKGERGVGGGLGKPGLGLCQAQVLYHHTSCLS